ncbi:MAG: amino acid transporter [Pirellulales bacterium]
MSEPNNDDSKGHSADDGPSARIPAGQSNAAHAGGTAGAPPIVHAHQSYWLLIMCLTGVDYFSTLGYQPSIAFNAAGVLAPLATVLLVLLTLFGALPVYCYVCSKSPHGQGSIAMLERLVHGWTGKALVLFLLGFAATDFVITKTLSAADAAEHMLHNPLWTQHMPLWVQDLGEHREQVLVTMFLLVVLGFSFLRGFREVIGLAAVIVVVYLVLNVIVIGSGLYYLAMHGDKFQLWLHKLQTGEWHVVSHIVEGHDKWAMLAICVLIFPKLALGLSGFETGVAVMPLIRGRADDDPHNPRGRILNTQKLLITAALIMSVMLLGSSLVTSTLIDPIELTKVEEHGPTGEVGEPVKGGKAADRALAFLAHGQGDTKISPLFGELFGTIYDISTVLILSFAGASAMSGLLNLVPQYLPRYGMAPEWTRAVRPLVLLFTIINLFVTWIFDADVEKQGGAYATGVLVLMSSACVATVIGRWREGSGKWFFRTPWFTLVIMLVFFYTTAANMVERPDGLKIASCFIAAIVASSFGSRLQRSKELRFMGFEFADHQSHFLWDSLKHLEFPVLVPHRPGARDLREKDEHIRARHRLAPDVPIVFIEAEVGDPSEFQQQPLLEVHESEGRFVIGVTRCASIAHVIATIALELSKVGKPPEIHFGWSNESPVAASLSFLLLGEGNVPWMVRELIRRQEADPARQPQVFIG